MTDLPSPTDVGGDPDVTSADEPLIAERGAVTVEVLDQQQAVSLDALRWGDLAATVLDRLGESGEAALTFVESDVIAALNAEHMGVDGPTDVLSFPLDAGEQSDLPSPRLIGDIVVCPAVAAEAAPTHAGTLDDELALLVVHAALHLVGYDHADPDEATEMRSQERELLSEFHWGGPPPDGFRHQHRDEQEATDVVLDT